VLNCALSCQGTWVIQRSVGLGHFPEVKNHTGPFIRAEQPGASYGRCVGCM